jgi:hypothetical protein
MLSSLKGMLLGAPLLVAALSSTAFAQSPDNVRIRGISYAGTGCPAGSVAENISPDFQALTLLFDSYVVEAGLNVPLSESRKNCQLLVDLDFPNGWQYSIFTVDYRGYLALDPGSIGQQTARYYFQGQPQTSTLTTTFRGPDQRDYQIRDTFGLTSTVWSPCGAQRALNINSSINVRANRGSRALMTNDSIDLQVHQVYGIRWQRCR